jgi:hypothetical protein
MSTRFDTLAARLNYPSGAAMLAVSEVFDHGGALGADVTAFVTPAAGQGWLAWDDADLDHCGRMCDTREEALTYLASGVEAARSLES